MRPQHYDNTVLLCPSEKFIDSLPHCKVPDRNDFVSMDREQRMSYWKVVMDESEKLAKSFKNLYENQDTNRIKNINQLLA